MNIVRLLLLSGILFCFNDFHAQVNVDTGDEDPDAAVQPMYLLKMSSGVAQTSLGLAKAGGFNKGATNWNHPLGIDFTIGIGYSYLHKNSFGIEGYLSYELNYYMYKHSNTSLFLGYRAPYIDLKFKKNFTKTEDNTFFIKGGGGFMLLGSGSANKAKSNYDYTISFASPFTFLVIGEIGKQIRLSKSNYIDVALVYRHGFSNVLNFDMNYITSENPLTIENAISSTRGDYFGVSFKYHHAFKIVSPEITSRRAPDKRF